MTVARDAVLEFATFTTTSPATLSFTPTGTPRGIVVHVVVNLAVTDQITGVTYGGVPMGRWASTFDTSVSGRVYTYFLGAGIPTGTQTVEIAHTGTAQVKWAIVQSFTAAADTQPGTVGMDWSGGAANPTVPLDSGAISALRTGILLTSHDDISSVTPLAGMEANSTATTHDFGNEVALLGQQTTAGTGSFNLGFTATTSSFGIVGLAVEEVPVDGFPNAPAPVIQASHDVAFTAAPLPLDIDAGDLLLIFLGTISFTVPTPADWTLLNTAVNSYELNIYYKEADGSEGGSSVAFAGMPQGASQAYAIKDWDGVTVPEVGTAASGSSAAPNPPSLTPSWGAEDTLWIAAAVVGLNGVPAVTDYPDDYDNGGFAGSHGTQAQIMATARRKLNATSDDPNTFTTTNGPWVAQTVAIRPAAGVPSNVSAAGNQVTITGDGTVTIRDSGNNIVYQGGAAVITLPAGSYSWTSTDGPSGSFSIAGPSSGGNRMGGTGAIRRPPRTFLHGR